MKSMKKYGKLIALPLVAFGLVAASAAQDSMAYFTTYVSAGGSEIIRLGAQTEIHEDVQEMVKHVSVTNTSQTNDCFVRVKVFYAAPVTVEISGSDWEPGEDDGYWYYKPVVPAGSSTGILDAKIVLPAGFDKDNFNVVVVQECTPVVYDESGNPSADWTTVFSDYQETGNNSEGGNR